MLSLAFIVLIAIILAYCLGTIGRYLMTDPSRMVVFIGGVLIFLGCLAAAVAVVFGVILIAILVASLI